MPPESSWGVPGGSAGAPVNPGKGMQCLKSKLKNMENGPQAVEIPYLFRLETSNPSPIKFIDWAFSLRWKEFQINDNQ